MDESLKKETSTATRDLGRLPVDRASGSTESERYLQRLCERSFLKFWSYPRVFQDDGIAKIGQGKELCDLLVVFGNDILIFSDKHCEFPNHTDLQISWGRWFKRAVLEGANQVFGAERRIRKFPDRLFLDPRCTKPFPFPLPSIANARFHRIVVAHGASGPCQRHFGGSGSLMVDSKLVGRQHTERQNPPTFFTTGQIDPKKGFVHIFDDATLNIVMRTLDTVADFVAYLTKKESFLNRAAFVIATGEEELLTYYLKNLNAAGEHDFVLPPNIDGLCMEEGHWLDFCEHPQRLGQIEANRVSYAWDELIEKFSHHIMSGTQHFSSSLGPHESEEAIRFLAAENRTRRRMLAQSLLDVVAKANPQQRFTKIIQGSRPNDPFYVLLSMPSTYATSEEEYREVRRNLLEAYCLVCKHVYPNATSIVGIAISPISETGCSEDLETVPPIVEG